MSSKRAYIFGYNKSTGQVAKELIEEKLQLSIIVNDHESYDQAKYDGYIDVSEIDVTNDSLLEALNIAEDDYIVCVMENNHLNVFLTLSLRSLYPENIIVSLSDSVHTTQKLKMAGATKIIDLYKVSANRVFNILNKPVMTQLIERLFSTTEAFSFKEMFIPENSPLDGLLLNDFDFRPHNIILVGMIDRRVSDKFIFITSGIEHHFDKGDTLVCMGYNDDLNAFQTYLEGEESECQR